MKIVNSLLVVFLLTLVSFRAAAQEYPRGDVDKSGDVNISDVTILIDNLLNAVQEGDVDQDGVVNIMDMTCLIDYLLTGSWPDEPVTPPDVPLYVDLGLPSGTLWATCNIGADKPEDYGSYFAWGEIMTKDTYSVENYRWCNGSIFELTKYNYKSSYGNIVDWKTELDFEDDAANRIWGLQWRMPSTSDVNELKNNCTKEWTTLNGVSGCKLTGPNGNTLFLPAGGFIEVTTCRYLGHIVACWTRTLYDFEPTDAFTLSCSYDQYYTYVSASSNLRWAGLTIRPVIYNN